MFYNRRMLWRSTRKVVLRRISSFRTMSNPPTSSASLQPTSSSKKKVRSTPTSVSKKLLMELQALIAFASYDSPSLAGGGN